MLLQTQGIITATLTALLAATLTACAPNEPDTPPGPDADVIIVGAGISGLSAAVEMGRAGISVLVVDMNSVPGGHAVLAGGFAIVDTPLQTQAGYTDSPDLAFSDWQEWTEDGDEYWSRFYAENSREMVYDWVIGLGIEWDRVQGGGHENSIPRFHFTAHGAVDVVEGLMRTALQLPTVSFIWNQRVEHLTTENGIVTGVETIDVRTDERHELQAAHTVLATGGFEGNLERVLANWTPGLPVPGRLLIGASTHARGEGLDLAAEAGAELTKLDRHYIYTTGIVNIRDPEGVFAITAGNGDSVWVNANGERFTSESGHDKDILVDLLDQEESTYWAIFDEPGRAGFAMRGVEWVNTPTTGHPILDNPEITSKANTLGELATLTGLPAEALETSIARYNELVESGEDTDFQRFGVSDEAPPRVAEPPFYALQFYPMTRKSMGGVLIATDGRAMGNDGEVVPGLYAVGELTGSVGINGKHGMDGMFLGPAVLTGRIAGQTIVATQTEAGSLVQPDQSRSEDDLPDINSWEPSLTESELETLVSAARAGYWHFNKSHEMVLEREYDCTLCHSAQMPFYPVNNRTSKNAQLEICSTCHGRR